VYGSSRKKRREEYQSLVKDKVAEAEYINVNEHWRQIKNEVAETVREKNRNYGN